MPDETAEMRAALTALIAEYNRTYPDTDDEVEE
jgi:hypothetical protein